MTSLGFSKVIVSESHKPDLKDREIGLVPVLCQEVTTFSNTVELFGMTSENLKESLSQFICNSLHVHF